MIHFEHPYLLYLLVLIPIFIIIYIIVKRNQNKRLAAFADKQMFERLTPDVSHSKAVFKYSLILVRSIRSEIKASLSQRLGYISGITKCMAWMLRSFTPSLRSPGFLFCIKQTSFILSKTGCQEETTNV